jgi:hypothetical protein
MKSWALILSSAAIAAFACAHPAQADQASDLAAIKAQHKVIQHHDTAKIHSLEVRLAKAEADAKAARAAVAKSTGKPAKTALLAKVETTPEVQTADNTPAPAGNQSSTDQTVIASADQAPTPVDIADNTPAPSAPASQNAFNPGIAAVLNGFYFASSRDPATQRILGFANGDESGHPARGFSLGESEVSFAANIDPFLSGFLDISFDDANQPSVEEAYVTTHGLPWGLTLKAGRFLSGIGYTNERHAHDWLFSDAALPYRAFLNNQYGDDGLQVRWLAPTDQFLEFGAEVFRGDAYPAGGSRSGQSTVTAFVHTGNDINDSSSYLAGLSYLHAHAAGRTTEAGDLFTGNDDLGIASLVYKWAPGGNPTVNNLSLTGEVFYGRESGLFNGLATSQKRFGWYAQGDYQFMPQWSVGLRYAQVSSSDPGALFAGTALDDFGQSPHAATALLEYDTSEFGRFRVQYTHDQTDLKPNDEVLFQYTVIYGPHGAHRY